MGRLQKGVNDLKTWCFSNGEIGQQLMEEWTGEVDGKKNVGIDEVSRGNGRQKAKWRCSKGHEWLATIASRTNMKSGCPYCAYVSKENSLKSWCISNGSFGKQLMNEWECELEDKKNIDIGDVTKASHKKAKWKCSKGHEWFAKVVDRTSHKSSCPYCSGNLVSDRNSLKEWCLSNGSFGLQLMSEWTGEVEGKKDIDISDVARANHKKAKWRCSKGHEWSATIISRTNMKSGCPYCSNIDRAKPSEENSLKTWCLSNGSFGQRLMSEWTGETENNEHIEIDEGGIEGAGEKKR